MSVKISLRDRITNVNDFKALSEKYPVILFLKCSVFAALIQFD